MLRRAFVSGAAAALAAFAVPALAAPAAAKKARRVAVVYFSRTGHTRSVAKAVQKMTGADLYELQLAEPYPSEYRRTTEIVKEEIARGYYRPVKPIAIDLSRYDTLVIGTPTWWHHVSGPVRSWIGTAKPAGKTILPFNNHGGGGMMETRSDFEQLLKGNRLGTHLTIFGETEESSSEVRLWLQENGLV